MTGAVSVRVSTVSYPEMRAGPSPSTALHQISVRPIPFLAAKKMLVENHYLHSLPGGTKLAFGVFLNHNLFGTITFGAGPSLVYSLVEDAQPEDCLTLTRLWLSDQLPSNSESRVISVALRAIRKFTHVKFVVTYADPSHEHMGTIYQATNFLYTGLSEKMPLFDIGDGKPRHSRTLSHSYGTHSIKYLVSNGVNVKIIPQAAKHRYIYFLDQSWGNRLQPQVLPYPKKEEKPCKR
jgi:hypothetical protein